MAAKAPQLAVGVDAGSSVTRCVICAVEGERIRYLAHGSAPAGGWTRGKISDHVAVAESMHEAVVEAERSAGVIAEAVTLGIGGPEIVGAQSRGIYEFGRPREIDHDDLSYAVDRAMDVRLEHDRMLLHVLPQDFVLDGKAGYRKPHKGVCSRLESNVHIITAPTQQHQALVAAAHLAHLRVEETVFEAMAAAYACARPQERARGVAVVDLGKESTGVVVYDGEKLMLASSVPVTSDHLTRDIAWIFKVSYEDAEALKQQYGCALLGLTADSTLIEIPTPEGRGSREARRSDLIDVLQERADQLFSFVKAEIQRSGMDRRLMEGIMLTGGGALLPGMWDMAELKLNCQACYGLARDIGGWPAELKNPLWTTAAGLAMYSAKLKLHQPPQKRARGLIGVVAR